MSTQRRAATIDPMKGGPPPALTDGGIRGSRRLRPDVAARLVERRREERLQELYDRPVSELSESDLLLMREAFFRGT